MNILFLLNLLSFPVPTAQLVEKGVLYQPGIIGRAIQTKTSLGTQRNTNEKVVSKHAAAEGTAIQSIGAERLGTVPEQNKFMSPDTPLATRQRVYSDQITTPTVDIH